MHIQALAILVRQYRTHHPVPLAVVGIAQARMQPRTQHAHGGILQPTALPHGGDGNDFGRRWLAEAFFQCVRDQAGGEVLILEQQRMISRRNRVKMQASYFHHAPLPVECRLGARNGNVHIHQIGLQPVWPA